jgi:hypothetical protein
MRKGEQLYEDEINKLTHVVQLKINENRKLGHSNIELEEELSTLKKLIRTKN